MRLLLSFLPAFACAGLMFACMRMMGAGHRDRTENDTASEIAELRAEVARLRAERADPSEHDHTIGGTMTPALQPRQPTQP